MMKHTDTRYTIGTPRRRRLSTRTALIEAYYLIDAAQRVLQEGARRETADVEAASLCREIDSALCVPRALIAFSEIGATKEP